MSNNLISTGDRKVIRDEARLREKGCPGRVQRWRLIREGKFPAPIKLGANRIGFFEDEIDAWLASRPRVTYAPQEAA